MHHILCESPFISRDFYAIRPLILWHILGSYFLLIWAVGVVRIIFKSVPTIFGLCDFKQLAMCKLRLGALRSLAMRPCVHAQPEFIVVFAWLLVLGKCEALHELHPMGPQLNADATMKVCSPIPMLSISLFLYFSLSLSLSLSPSFSLCPLTKKRHKKDVDVEATNFTHNSLKMSFSPYVRHSP